MIDVNKATRVSTLNHMAAVVDGGRRSASRGRRPERKVPFWDRKSYDFSDYFAQRIKLLRKLTNSQLHHGERR